MSVQGMLHLLDAEPTLLPSAPDSDEAQAIDRRTKDEVHVCLRCGQRAQVAYIAATDIGPRWLDLCAACDYALRADNP